MAPRGLLALAATAAAASTAAAFMPPVLDDGWYQGRATFFGAPDAFTRAFDNRGDGSFGDFMFGSCGYFNKPRAKQHLTYDDVPFPHDGVAALADVNPDFPGSCGRCYEVKCLPGLLLGNNHSPIQLSEFYNMAAVRTDVKDSFGRKFPGNPYSDKNRQYVECWGGEGNNATDAPSSIVRIVDNCPTAQFKDGRTVPQMWCAADVYHIDLSYWAFEKLAHPIYGVMNVKLRPVDCETGQPFAALVPGFVSRSIYSNTIQPGWAWSVWEPQETELMRAGLGHNGGAALYASVLAKGGMTFNCKRCAEGGYQPFAGAQTLSVWMKDMPNPNGTLGYLPLRVNIGRVDKDDYCGGAVYLKDYGASAVTEAGHKRFDIPMSSFYCADLASVESVVISVTGTDKETAWALDHLEIRGPDWRPVPEADDPGARGVARREARLARRGGEWAQPTLAKP
jgi:hypothetical protein